MKNRRYCGHKPGYIFRKVCRSLSGVGFLVVFYFVGSIDAGAPLGSCMIGAIVGLVMFAGFGYLGGLLH